MIYERTRNLWLVVALHFAVDIAFLVLSVPLIGPVPAFLSYLGVALAALLWWSLDRSDERMGI